MPPLATLNSHIARLVRNTRPVCRPRQAHLHPLRAALGSNHHCPLHPLRAAFRSLLASVHPLARSCSTAASKTGRRFAPFSSRRPHHITANAHPSFRTPHLILLHTQTSRSSSLPFKPVRLLHAPLAAPPGACCLRSVLPSVAPSSNRQPFLSVAFHHLSGANLAAPSDTNLLLLVPVSTDYFAPHPIPLHTQTSQTSLLPFKHIRLLCAPLAALSGSRRLRSVLPSQHSPATVSRSRPSALSGMNLYRLPSAYAPHAHHQTNGHVSFLRPATVHDPHFLLCASPDPRRLAFRHPRRALHPPFRVACRLNLSLPS